MRLLLDTHALIWALEDSRKLSAKARRAIEDGRNEVLTSAVSAWEIAIKSAMGRLTVPSDLDEAVEHAGFTPLPLAFSTAQRLKELPEHHRDPFDRMLIAQALDEQVPIVTADRKMSLYRVAVFW